eukprot:TRINITY_DN25589_c0_g1_i1.p2 TRINITY_DN25589_c0_g1~~TRINITY_DN25589_c0_g1_i1.p2  ORF type:complete len:111 (-),score=2.80 TRINITY_DN25589_c0_g1_i1:13-345(-)
MEYNRLKLCRTKRKKFKGKKTREKKNSGFPNSTRKFNARFHTLCNTFGDGIQWHRIACGYVQMIGKTLRVVKVWLVRNKARKQATSALLFFFLFWRRLGNGRKNPSRLTC